MLPEINPSYSKHDTVWKDTWMIAGFREDEITFNPNKIVDEFDGLLKEIIDCGANPRKTVMPHYMDMNENIVLTAGMTHALKLWSGEESATPDWFSLGTGTTAEDETQTDLVTEDSGGSYARIQSSVSGQRKVLNQTFKAGVQWLDSNISATGIVVGEVGYNWTVSTAGTCLARSVPTAFTFSAGDIYVTRLNISMANATL